MKTLLSAILCVLPTVCLAQVMGTYPNALRPFNGTELLMGTQVNTGCISSGCVVEFTPSEIADAVSVEVLASGTSATPDCDYGLVKVTASATGAFTINAPAICGPLDGQRMELKITSPSGGTLIYSWNAAYLASSSLSLPATSKAASTEDYLQFQYDADRSKWVLLWVNQGF